MPRRSQWYRKRRAGSGRGSRAVRAIRGHGLPSVLALPQGIRRHSTMAYRSQLIRELAPPMGQVARSSTVVTIRKPKTSSSLKRLSVMDKPEGSNLSIIQDKVAQASRVKRVEGFKGLRIPPQPQQRLRAHAHCVDRRLRWLQLDEALIRHEGERKDLRVVSAAGARDVRHVSQHNEQFGRHVALIEEFG
eukprot:scaffold252446_cov33-Tisochrysis_lutea.AAC.1